MSDFEPIYRNCLTCGRLMPLQADSKQVYCSSECSQENLCCPVCRRFFDKGAGIEAPPGPPVCSEDCARIDHRYDHLFKELP